MVLLESVSNNFEERIEKLEQVMLNVKRSGGKTMFDIMTDRISNIEQL